MVLGFFGASPVFAQQPQLATFQETVQILFDKQISNNVTASISLQSTSNQEMKIPSELENKILNNSAFNAVILTNEEQCVLGVLDESCIMINVLRDDAWEGIFEIQDETRLIGDSLIDDINKVFDTDANFHSVFLHHKDEINVALETSGVVSGRGTVSAVYTMPLEATDSMYEKLSSILLPKTIRDSGGFYDTALSLSSERHAKMTFAIIPRENNSLFQLKLSVDYPSSANVSKIEPLKYLKTEELARSDYFSSGFYPLNSLIHVALVSDEFDEIKDSNSDILQTREVLGDKVPTDLTKNGWVFDPDEGERIEGKYLFGKKNSVTSSESAFTLLSYNEEITQEIQPEEFDESSLVIVIISIGAAGAALFYLKGYRKGP